VYGVVVCVWFADIDADEYVDVSVVGDHVTHLLRLMCPDILVVVRLAGDAGWLLGSASTLRSGSRHDFCQWFWPLSAISLAPSNPGDYTPQIIGDWGHQSCRDPQASDPFLS